MELNNPVLWIIAYAVMVYIAIFVFGMADSVYYNDKQMVSLDFAIAALWPLLLCALVAIALSETAKAVWRAITRHRPRTTAFLRKAVFVLSLPFRPFRFGAEVRMAVARMANTTNH